MDYTPKIPTKVQIITKALRACANNCDCDSCPYEYRSEQCYQLLDTSADMIDQMEKETKKNA